MIDEQEIFAIVAKAIEKANREGDSSRDYVDRALTGAGYRVSRDDDLREDAWYIVTVEDVCQVWLDDETATGPQRYAIK